MEVKPEKTQFAPAERATKEKILEQSSLFKNNDSVVNISDSVSQMLVILNKERQIVFANKLFKNLLNYTDEKEYIGKRPGEAVKCIHSTLNEGGCGTTEFCKTCGAVNAILESQNGIQSVKECRISTKNNDALDLQITATPFTFKGQELTIFVILDISNEKRRQTLERVFFHDVLNSAGGISGLSSVISDIDDPKEINEIAQMIHRSSDHLISEIMSQRQLSSAERGDLELNTNESDSIAILKLTADLYSKHEITQGKFISIDKNSEGFSIITDIVLLRRILGNMLKNALEASLPSSFVTLSCKKKLNSTVFSVHNNNYIEKQTQLQLFKRSFTTKGVGRGVGTYSMKLFGEKYLKGKVDFESTPENGTTFFIEIPNSI